MENWELDLPNSWEDLDDVHISEMTQQLRNPEPVFSETVLDFSECIRGENQGWQQRNAITKLAIKAKKHNQQFKYKETPMSITNTKKDIDQFHSYVIGFDGKLHPCRVMLDSGCTVNGVIGPNIAKKAGIVQDKFGCSYAFVIYKNDFEFVGTAISTNKNRYSNCYISG